MQPDGRTCTQCKEAKPAVEFSWRGPDHKRLTSRCHACRRANYKEDPERNRQRAADHYRANREVVLAQMKSRWRVNLDASLLKAARQRAKARGLPFELCLSDIEIPTHCPVLGIPLRVNDGKCGPDSPTLDRVIPERGYVRGNVVVISHRANTIKSDSTLAELLAAARYIHAMSCPLYGVKTHAWAALGVAITALETT